MTKIFINPRHCMGVEPGAFGNGLKEAEYVLKIAHRVQDYLQAVEVVTKVSQYDGLGEICADSNSWGADLFLSIHCNSATDSASGTETLYCAGSAKGEKFAECVQNQILKALGTVDRGIKTNSLYVTNHANADGVLNSQHVLGTAADSLAYGRLLIKIDCYQNFIEKFFSLKKNPRFFGGDFFFKLAVISFSSFR